MKFYETHETTPTVSDIIKFTYYHCTSIDYSILCEWSTLYFECTTQYTILQFSTMLSYTNVKGIHTLLWLQYKVLLYIVLLRSIVDYHLIEV